MTTEYWTAVIERMEAGDTDSARRFLEECITTLANGEAVPPPVARTLAAKLNALHAQPWDAPLLRRPRKRPYDHQDETTQRRLAQLIAFMHELGEPIKAAKYRAALVFFPDRSDTYRNHAASTAWRKFGKDIPAGRFFPFQ